MSSPRRKLLPFREEVNVLWSSIYRDGDKEEMDTTTGVPMEVDEQLDPRRNARLSD